MLRRFIHPECAADLKMKTGCDHSYCKRKETFAKRPLLPPATVGCQAQILILKILNVFLWLKF
jgi:hypothetical protein